MVSSTDCEDELNSAVPQIPAAVDIAEVVIILNGTYAMECV